jgi:hypothetical protein
MTDRGEIPVEYRGTHRRIRQAAIMEWLETQKRKQAETSVGDKGEDNGRDDAGNDARSD